MDYPEERGLEYRRDWRNRRRKQVLVLLIFLLILFLLAVVGKGNAAWGRSILRAGFLLPLAGMLATGFASFTLYNWRCPACGASLGISFHPGHCRRCGVPFR